MAATTKARNKKTKNARRIPGLRPLVPQPAFLFEEFADGPPHAPPSSGESSSGRTVIAEVQKLYLLYKVAQGFPPSRVARELEISDSSAKRILNDAQYDPEKLYRWGFVVRWKSDSSVKYFCRYCAWIENKMVDCVVHAYGHLWDTAVLKPAPKGYK